MKGIRSEPRPVLEGYPRAVRPRRTGDAIAGWITRGRFDVRRTLFLGADEPLHRAQRLVTELHRGIDPRFGDLHELVQADRAADLAHAIHRRTRVRDAVVAADDLVHGGDAFALRDEHVDDADLVQLVARVDGAVEHHLLGELRADALAEERVRAHAGEEIEQDFGEAHADALLGDDRLARQRRFEAAAERVALNERDRMRVAVEVGVEAVDAFDALTRVGEQVLAVARADQAAEQIKIAAEVENVCIGGEDNVRKARVAVCRAHRQLIARPLLELADLLDERR